MTWRVKLSLRSVKNPMILLLKSKSSTITTDEYITWLKMQLKVSDYTCKTLEGGVVNHDHEIMRCKLLIVLSGQPTCTVS